MNTKRTWPWIVIIVGLVLMLACGGTILVSLMVVGSSGGTTIGFWAPKDTVAVIKVHGVIVSGEAPGGFGGQGMVYARTLVDRVKQVTENPRVAAIVLDVNSPGGGVVASAHIHEALVECPKPIVVSMGDTAASGGYYISAGAQYIFAHPATMTGSIGVIMSFINADELAEKLGVTQVVIKSGAFKDMGSWSRPLEEEERELLQAFVDEAYNDFVEVVVQGRGLSEEHVRRYADGRIFSGSRAVELGFVDATGDLEDAIDKAAELGGIRGEPEILRFDEEPSLLRLLQGALARLETPSEVALYREIVQGNRPTLQYLYTDSGVSE
ncbi:MAG: signal peptide peptidase SppA [Chloroflexota bacterium]|nr:signal peptide peptidase SppA [Chloroflexota bacterium]